ncbi:Sodium/potassium-transporting ATPase subunit like protein [Argiope bruennichi]|uniref:Sodium/potassium-transporting ATPase subunit like protein n=1 Tax=Argiope bruennichi TaxID=94029 RepID=A0A8T0FE40_ARGBR|nr:Sodium/potassium-transporting ATPase subunit like protein [Argiope bruennichi]
MHHSQSYPVTTVQVNLPQPHVSYSTKSQNSTLCSGWCAFVMAGVFASAFLICVYVFGGHKIFLVGVDPSTDLVLIMKQGSLEVYPFLMRTDVGIESRYLSYLPPKNFTQAVNSLDALFQAYPAKHDDRYRNCWLENPSAENPCFFDATWLAEVCTRQNSYGYEEREGYYSPCFVMRLEQTGDWRPRFSDHIPTDTADHYDPGFSPVHCYAHGDRGQDLSPNITIYPNKGFSHLFFPSSKFNPERYLLPMVAVKLHRIPKGRNLTVECSVVTPNAFFLWNNGKAAIRFEAA